MSLQAQREILDITARLKISPFGRDDNVFTGQDTSSVDQAIITIRLTILSVFIKGKALK